MLRLRPLRQFLLLSPLLVLCVAHPLQSPEPPSTYNAPKGQDSCSIGISSRLRWDWLAGENVTIVLQKEMNTSFFFVEDAPEQGIDPIRAFLQRAEENIRELYHHILFTPGCKGRDPEALWGSTCGTKGIVIDVGANRGYYTLLAASYGHDVLAFEPQPHCNSMMSTCVLLSGLSCRVDIRYTFVSDKPGATMQVLRRTGCTGTFPNDDHDGWASGFRRPLTALEGADDLVTVRGERIDHAVGPHIHVRLLKVDAEGHEANALRSAAKLLTDGRVDNLLVEFNVPMLKRQPEGWAVMKDRTLRTIKWLMVDLGYKVKGSHKGHWTTQEPMHLNEWVGLFDDPSFTTIDAWFFKPL